MIALHTVGRVDDPSNLGRVVEVGGQFGPVRLPGTDSYRVFVSPSFTQLNQVHFSLFSCCRLIDKLQVGHKRLAVFPGDVLQTVANLVDDAALHLGLREDGLDGLAETVQPVNTGQKDIRYAPVLQVGQDAQPEVGSFATVAEPVAQDCLLYTSDAADE